tara:strand:- start:1422 stop:1583 length:162 start_codon:yes stop_codon:yes gene_type:complete
MVEARMPATAADKDQSLSGGTCKKVCLLDIIYLQGLPHYLRGTADSAAVGTRN